MGKILKETYNAIFSTRSISVRLHLALSLFRKAENGSKMYQKGNKLELALQL